MISLRAQGLRLLLSVGLAVALWIFVSFTQNPDQRISFEGVPVDIEGLAPGLVLVDTEGLPRANRPTVNITVEADEASLRNVLQSDLRAFVDLTGRGPGESNNVPVVVVPNRSGLARLNLAADPQFLSFRIEQEITRTVPLTIELAGSVPFSFEKGEPRLTSQNEPITSVSVRGPQSHVDQVYRARVTADIDRLTANYSSSRPVEAVDRDGQVIEGLSVEPASVNVLVPIVSSAGIKRVPVVPRLVGSPASGYIVSSVAVDPQFVQLTGGSGSLDGVQNIETLNVDISGANREITRTVSLSAPFNTGLASGEPTTATVRVQVRPIERPFQVTVPVGVQLADVPDGLLALLSPQSVRVTLSGSAADVGALDPSSLQATVSARGLDEGTYSLDPRILLPRGLALVGTPPKVTLTLRRPPTPTPVITPTETTAPTETPEAAPAETPTDALPTAAPAATPAAATPAETPTP